MAGLQAVACPDNFWFKLHDGTSQINESHLPSYEGASQRVKQVLLTPVTVTADATIVGGVAGFYVLAQSGSSFSPGRH